MKGDGARAATCLLTPEEQRMLLFPEVPADEGNTADAEWEISSGMCSALADLGASVNGLLQLLERQGVAESFPVEARADYAQLTQRVGSAAVQVSRMVEGSRGLEDELRLPSLSFCARQ